MISKIAIVSLLSVLVASFPVLCQQMDFSPEEFFDQSFRCLYRQNVALIYTESSYDGKKYQGVTKTCNHDESLCNMTFSFSMHNQYDRRIISCCNTHACQPNKSKFVQQMESFKPNGRFCPSCLFIGSTWCSTSKTVQCSGSETMCIHNFVKVIGQGKDFVQRGCATQTHCDHDNSTMKGAGMSEITRSICVKAQPTINLNQFKPVSS